ncbi:MAG: hypothetical protein AAFV86_22390, partial [Pseudomonadota bacterium]
MQFIAFDEATARPWDVVIAGTSFAASFFAHALRGRGLGVLFVEKGGMLSHADMLADRLRDRYAAIPQDNRSPHRKDWTVLHQFGGCSNCWWGNAPRLHPSDFTLRSDHGVGVDWPVGYDVLEPYFVRVEAMMEVAGGD